MLTLSELIIWVILGQFLQVISEQHLVTWDPLNGLQHVVLQGQAATSLLTLETGHPAQTLMFICMGMRTVMYPAEDALPGCPE